MLDTLPKRIGKYEIQSELGVGGFGRVFRAFDPTVSRVVAIKVLTAQGNPGLLTRFRNEAAAAGNLHHKNIVIIHESGDYNTIAFIAMEFLEGEDLQRVIDHGRQQTLLQKVQIMYEVAEGLSYAHLHGVVHRDVKPANIMLQLDGTVKIMDFGIARVASEGAERLTHQGDMIGTVRYMAPEQFASGHEVDTLSDIFAYGLVYYELLTGRHPFAAPDDNMAAFIGKLTALEPAPLRRLVPECPQELEAVVHRALQKDRELRYQNLDDLLADTRPILFELQKERAAALLEETRRMIADGRLDKAHINLRQVLELDPSNRDAQQLRPIIQRQLVRPRVETMLKGAESELSLRRYGEAIQLYESAMRLDNQDTQIPQLLEKARLQHEQSQKANRLLADAHQQLQQQNLTPAYRDASEALRADPGNQKAAELVATIQREIERRDNLKRLQEGVNKARGLMLLQEFDRALAVLAELEANPETTSQVAELIEKARQQKAQQERFQRQRQETDAVRVLIKESRFEESVAKLELLAQEFSDTKEVTDLLAYTRQELLIQQRAKDVSQAAEEAEKLLASGRYEETLQLLEKTLRLYPDESELQHFLKTSLAAKAAAERKQALEKVVLRCQELYGANRLAEGVQFVETALQQHGRDPELLDWQKKIQQEWERQNRLEAVQKALTGARLKIDQGRPDAAVAVLEQACVQYPGEPDLQSLLSAARERVRIQQRANEIEAAVNSARESMEKLDFDGAIAILQRTRQIYPDEPHLVRSLEDAEALKASHERRRSIREATGRSGQLSQLGRFAEARQLLEAHLLQYPNDPLLLDAERQLQADEERYQRAEAVRGIAVSARELIAQNHLDDAIALLARACDAYPGETALTSLRSIAQQSKLAEERKRFIQDRMERLLQFEAAGLWDDALGALEEIAGRYPDAGEIRGVAERLQKRRGEAERRQRLAAQIELIEASIQRGDWSKAIGLLAAARLEFPGEAAFSRLLDRARQGQTEAELAALVQNVTEALEREDYKQAEDLIARAPAPAKANPRILKLQEEIKWRKTRQKVLRSVRAALQKRRFDQAERILSKAYGKRDLDSQAGTLLESIRSERAAEENQKAYAKGCQDVQQLLRDNRLDDVTTLLHSLLVRFPNDPNLEDELRKTGILRLEDLQQRGDAQGVWDGATQILSAGDHPKARELLDWATVTMAGPLPEQPPAPIPVETIAFPAPPPEPVEPVPAPQSPPLPLVRRTRWRDTRLLLAGIALVLAVIAAVLAARNYWSVPDPWPEQRREALMAASVAFEQGRYHEVAPALQAVLAHNPKDRDAVRLLKETWKAMELERSKEETERKLREERENLERDRARLEEQQRLEEERRRKEQKQAKEKEAQSKKAKINENPVAVVPPPPKPKEPEPVPACPPELKTGPPVTTYGGNPERKLTWTGTLNPGCTLEIRNSAASTGLITPSLPGVQAKIQVTRTNPEAEVEVTLPSEGNHYTLKLRNKSNKAVNSIQMSWHDARN